MAKRIDAVGDGLRRTANLPSLLSFTIIARMYLVVDRTGEWRFALGFEDSLVNAGGYFQLGWSADTNALYCSGMGQGTFTNKPAVGGWVNVALWCGGTGANLAGGEWRNVGGGVVNTHIGTLDVSFTPVLMEFGNDSWNEWVSVRLDGIKVWNTVLTDQERLAEYDSLAPVKSANLDSFWLLQRGQANQYEDLSGNGKTLGTRGTITDENDSPLDIRSVAFGIVAPVVLVGGLTIIPAAVTFGMSGIDPLVEYGGVQIVPGVLTVGFGTIDPTVDEGSAPITPGAVTFAFAVNGPLVIMPGDVPPLGQDTPGFVAFMLARSFSVNLQGKGNESLPGAPDGTNADEWGTWLFGS